VVLLNYFGFLVFLLTVPSMIFLAKNYMFEYTTTMFVISYALSIFFWGIMAKIGDHIEKTKKTRF